MRPGLLFCKERGNMRRDIQLPIKKSVGLCLAIGYIGFIIFCAAAESNLYRLLSVSESEKLILVSKIPAKTKLLLDAATAKITVNGKPAEFKDLKTFSTIQIQMALKKTIRNGISIDGSVKEIQISNPEGSQ
jgi:hypothetical protein